jgi:hypothetical protein
MPSGMRREFVWLRVANIGLAQVGKGNLFSHVTRNWTDFGDSWHE